MLKKSGRQAFLLKLSGKSTGDAYAGGLSKGKPAAKTAAKNQLKTVRSAQARVASDLPSGARELYRTHAALNAIAVNANVREYRALQRISGVTAVYPIASKQRSNSYAVPLYGTPSVWQDLGNTGDNSTIAIIDTGLDYTHSNFGGPGTTEAYDEEHANEDQPANPAYFPNDKIIGGYDFAGDAYDASSDDPAAVTPHEDPNPLDCNGHGSHVGGSAAGLGVNSDGSAYAGPYDETTPFDTLKIGPGVAPGAKLYGFRVFGCEGSTDVVGAALDRAMDPNQDGDTSDAVDVVNMSLGSDFGSAMDGDAVLSNELAEFGVNVVVASGNGGDVFDVGGSPGNAVRTIAVANSVDEYSQLDALHVTAPAGLVGDYGSQRSVLYDWDANPDLAGTVARLSDPTNLEGCNPLSPADAAAVNGKIAWIEWTDTNGQIACGSIQRSGNVAAAGAIGFIFATNEVVFSAGINGSATIPGVMIDKAAGDALRASATAGTLVVNGTEVNGFRSVIDGIDDMLNGGSSRNSRNAGGVKPDVTAVGTSVFSTGVGTGSEGSNSSGTSMATPMVAGLTALVVDEHPDWTTEEVKADIMNTAGHDLWTEPDQTGTPYAPNRVGSGRIDAPAALSNDVLAYVTDDPGAVSASFGPLEVTEETTLTKTIKVANTSLSAASYDVSYEALTEIPGVEYSVSPESVTVGPRSSQTVTVTLEIDPAALTKTIDPTVDRIQAGEARHYVADASGRVVLDSTNGRPDLRVPVYSAPRPASQMSAPDSVQMTSGATQTGDLPLTGTPVDQGTGDESIFSIAGIFELQAESGPAPECTDEVTTGCVHNADEESADLKYVGTTATAYGPDPIDDGFAYFAIATHGPWYTAASQNEFDVLIDTNNDGTPEFVTINTRLADTDVLVSATFDLETGDNVDLQYLNDIPADIDTAVFDSDVLVLPVYVGALGVTEANSRISYAVESYSNQAEAPVDVIGEDDEGIDGSLSLDVVDPGLTVEGDLTGPIQFDDPAATVSLVRNRDSYQADNGLGALVLHFHNEVGAKAQKVELTNTTVASGVTLALAPTSVQAGKNVTATVTVANTENTVPTGAVTLKSGSKTLASGTLDGTGKAVITFKATPAGTHNVVAQYAGDLTYSAGSSAPQTLTVSKIKSKVKLKLPKTAGKGKTITATVTVPTVNGLVPTGKVKVKQGKKTLKSGTLKKGKAKVKFKITKKGTYKLFASYAGDGNYKKGKSSTKTIKIV